jgi:hypothetical protein
VPTVFCRFSTNAWNFFSDASVFFLSVFGPESNTSPFGNSSSSTAANGSSSFATFFPRVTEIAMPVQKLSFFFHVRAKPGIPATLPSASRRCSLITTGGSIGAGFASGGGSGCGGGAGAATGAGAGAGCGAAGCDLLPPPQAARAITRTRREGMRRYKRTRDVSLDTAYVCRVRIVPLTVAVVVAGCGPGSSPAPDAAGVRVTGCDDPAAWTAPALGQATLSPETGGGPCSPGQYPLHQVALGYFGSSGQAELGRTCWRVVDAAAGTGWTAGQEFSAPHDAAAMNVMGFGRTLTVEGRILGSDGTVLLAVEPKTFSLDKARILDADAASTIAVASADAWAEPDAVNLLGVRVATDEVLDATARAIGAPTPVTIHRTASGLVHRTWWGTAGNPQYRDLALGPGTRARVAASGVWVVIDTELVLVASDGSGTEVVKQRLPLGAEPREVVGTFYNVTLHMDGELAEYQSGAAGVTSRSMVVGDGVMLATVRGDPPMFFDGTTFHAVVRTASALEFDASRSFTPRPEDLAALGAPVAVMHGIVLGENGFLVAQDATSTVPGPRFASFADLLGDPGAHLGPVSADSAAYVVTRGDGTAALYNAPFIDYCD